MSEPSIKLQRHTSSMTKTRLLATDRAGSVLQTISGSDSPSIAYTAYGHRTAESGLSSLLGFNAEYVETNTGHYLLGRGKRAFNPVLMRFNSPDELSPFDGGGINSYVYCGGDPINFFDPSGSVKFAIMMGRARSIPTSPIAKNPLKTIRPTTSTITKHPGQTARNYQRNALTGESAPSTSGHRPAISTMASEELTVPPLRKTEPYAPKFTFSSPQVKNDRELLKNAKLYDRTLGSQPGFHPTAPKKMLEKLESAKQAAENATRSTHSTTQINTLYNEYRMEELSVKQHVIRKSKNSSTGK